MLGEGDILWKSSKQPCLARFTMESEFIAGQEADWLRSPLVDNPLWVERFSPISYAL